MLHEFRNNTLRPGNPFSTISSQVKVGGTLSPTRGFRSDSLVAQPRSGQRSDHIDRSTAQSTTSPSQIDVLHLRLATFRRKIDVLANNDTDGRCRQCRTKETTSPRQWKRPNASRRVMCGSIPTAATSVHRMVGGSKTVSRGRMFRRDH